MKSMAIGVIAAAALGAGFGQTEAVAQMPMKAPAAAAGPNWTGWYIGVNGGGIHGEVDNDTTVANNAPPGFGGFFALVNIPLVQTTSTTTINGNGSLFGGQLGAQWQNGHFTWGLEADYQGVRLRGSRTVGATYGLGFGAPFGFAFNQAYSSDWLATFRGRMGFVLDSYNMLFYGTLGGAVGNLKYSNAFADTFYVPGGAGAVAWSETRWGYAAGLGLDWAMSDHWVLRGEYLHVWLGEVTAQNFLMSSTAGVGAILNSRVTSFNEDIFRGAINYKL